MRILFTATVLMTLAFPAAAAGFGDEAYQLLKASFSYDTSYPLNARKAGQLKHGDVVLEKVVFTSFHDGSVPALLALPTKGKGPFPVVLLLHGLTGHKAQWLGDAFTHGGEVTTGLLDNGYAVMALDAQYHGDRAVYNDYVDPGEMVFERQWGVRYSNLMTQTVVDYRRAIDYLATRKDIDMSRVGALGYSMGAHMTFILGAVEPRITTIVACVVPATPGMPSAAATFARGLGNQSLLMLMGREDRFYTVEQAQALFDGVPGENKHITFFDSGHSLPAGYTTQAVAWVKDNL